MNEKTQQMLMFDPEKYKTHYDKILHKNKHRWKPVDYEFSLKAANTLREIKDLYNKKGNSGCYCSQLMLNDWGAINRNSVLRPCRACSNFVDIPLHFAIGKIDFDTMKKRIMRKRRFDNFDKIKMIKLVQRFKDEYYEEKKD